MTEPAPPAFDSFRFAIDEIDDPIWVVDRELQIVFVNEFLLERSGLTESELIGKPIVDLWERDIIRIENSEALQDGLEAILDGEVTERHTEVIIENEMRTHTRTVKSVPWTVDGTIEGVLNVARDITDRRTRERQLKILDRVLRHNVRNEMSVITGNAQIIEQTGGEDVTSYAANIRSTADRLLDTVTKERDIVDVLRKDLSRTTVDLDEVIGRRVDRLRADHPDVAVTVETPDEVRVKALESIDRAIEELFENAIEHNDARTPRVRVRVEDVDGHYRLEISDNGPGIPEEEVGVLTAAQIQPLYHGSGLGLWLVNWIVEESGGSLSFGDGNLGGSSVTMRLPKGPT